MSVRMSFIGQGDMSRFSVVISDRSLSSEPEKTHDTDLTVDHMSDTWLEYSFKLMQEGSRVSGEEKVGVSKRFHYLHQQS